MVKQILATSDKGTSGLGMKQSPEQEAKKPMEQKNRELCNFIKNAFVADGEVKMVLSDKPFKSKLYFEVEDSAKGKYIVAYGKLNING